MSEQPTRLDLEAAVAACVLIEGGSNVYHVDLPLKDFSLLPARAVIGAARASTPVDVLSVRAWAQANDLKVAAADVSELLNSVPTSKNFLHYLELLKIDLYQTGIQLLRRELSSRSKNEDLLELAREISEREAELARRYLNRDCAGNLVEASADLLLRIEQKTENAALLPTHWDVIDEMHGGGFLPNELIIIAARPSVGKTAAALQICANCAARQIKTVFFSLEMSLAQIAPRLLAGLAKTNTKIASRQPNQVPEHIREALLASSSDLMEVASQIAVYDQPDQSAASIRRLARKEVEAGAKLVVIDYLQLVQTFGDTREQAVAQVSRELKNLSKELATPVILLAQLNRACESEKRQPRISDLRESGAIEQDANSVFLLHDSGVKTPDGYRKVVVIMAKGRDTGRDYRMTTFNSDHQRFYQTEETSAEEQSN